jgi:large repetitive protein
VRGPTSGLTVTGNGTGTVTVVGPLSALKPAVEGQVEYVPPLNTPPYAAPTGATISLSLCDGGATGSGGVLCDTDSVAISVHGVNEPPTVRFR